jgi:hypothetical protein
MRPLHVPRTLNQQVVSLHQRSLISPGIPQGVANADDATPRFEKL